MSSVAHDVERTANAVSEYLEAHPMASDTVEGVLQWWLPAHAFGLSLEHVRAALEYLVGRGLVVARTRADGSKVYAAAIAAAGRNH